MNDINHIIIVDKLPSPICEQPGRLILEASDYFENKIDYNEKKPIKMINLCNDYDYLKKGYYCSLLADARGDRCIPDVTDIAYANWKRIYRHAFTELEEVLTDTTIDLETLPNGELFIFFGRTHFPALERLARKIFDIFRMPALRLKIKRKGKSWTLDDVGVVPLKDLGVNIDAFNQALNQFVGAYWAKSSNRNSEEQYWLAILHDPEEVSPPSNKKALQKMITIGQKMGFYVELITKKDFHSLLEFDALFIRETTAVNNHTYRFAQKAANEGIPCIDDTTSILRCCNKVYLQELLKTKHIKTPKGCFFHKQQKKSIQLDSLNFTFPFVLKIPDGSFSRGVFKVNSREEFDHCLSDLFKKSELILCQEFVPSDYDWRIVILGGKPLFACKYFMAPGHWKIVNYDSKKYRYGDATCVPIRKVPEIVLKTALKACKLIGNGLYGVDLKEVNKEVYVIEVNDNPNIALKIEDELLGDALYAEIFKHFRKIIRPA